MRRILRLGVAALACATSPTGRRQLMLLPEQDVDQMGAQAFSQLKTQTPEETDPAINGYVRCVVAPVARVAGPMAHVAQWEVVVFRTRDANAFALPGGKIGVLEGILPIAKTPGQLATVLAHETGHVIARHGDERISQQLAVEAGTATVAALMGDSRKRPLVLAALGVGATVGLLLPFSRTQESEADAIGLDVMARAGFDPAEAIGLWRNMIRSGGGQPPQFLSDHPSHETRIAALERRMPRARALYQAAVAQGRAPRCQPPARVMVSLGTLPSGR